MHQRRHNILAKSLQTFFKNSIVAPVSGLFSGAVSYALNTDQETAIQEGSQIIAALISMSLLRNVVFSPLKSKFGRSFWGSSFLLGSCEVLLEAIAANAAMYGVRSVLEPIPAEDENLIKAGMFTAILALSLVARKCVGYASSPDNKENFENLMELFVTFFGSNCAGLIKGYISRNVETELQSLAASGSSFAFASVTQALGVPLLTYLADITPKIKNIFWHQKSQQSEASEKDSLLTPSP